MQKQKMKRETPLDMASRLTQQILHESFPNLDPEMLNEILFAHGGNFNETVQVLETNVGQRINKEDAMDRQKSLIDKVKRENIEFDRGAVRKTFDDFFFHKREMRFNVYFNL